MIVPKTIITCMDGNDGSLGRVVTSRNSNRIYETSAYVDPVPLPHTAGEKQISSHGFDTRRDHVYREFHFSDDAHFHHNAGIHYMAGKGYKFARCFTVQIELPEPEAILTVNNAYESENLYQVKIAEIAGAVEDAYHKNPVRPLSLIVPFSITNKRFDQLCKNADNDTHPDLLDFAEWSSRLLSPKIEALGLPGLEPAGLCGYLRNVRRLEVFALTEQWLPDTSGKGPYAFVARFAA